MRNRFLTCVAFALAVTCAPRAASADWLLTPFAGVAFSGDVDGQRATYGVSFGYMGAGVIGFEADLGFTPNFLDLDVGGLDIADTNVTTLMGNIIVGVPIGGTHGGGIRPYATAGLGLLRSKLNTIGDLFEVSNNDFGINFGGGVMGFVNDNIGFRGDLRYFRSLNEFDWKDIIHGDLDFDHFDFWRATGGVVIRF